jgi:hypothetical protein
MSASDISNAYNYVQELRAPGRCKRLAHPGTNGPTQDWLLTHARQLMATIALLLGAYLVINGAVHLG